MAPHPSLRHFRKFLRFWLCWLCFVVPVGFMGCADSSDHHQRDAGAVGSLSFRINWEDAGDTDAVPARFACGSASDEVAFVDAQMVNSAHTVNLNSPWACNNNGGTLDQVPVGSGYALTLSAYNQDGVVLYSAERIEITILPGVNDLGVLNGISFETSLIAPASDASGVSHISPSFRWESVAGAAGYQLLIFASANLANPVFTDTVDDVSVTLAGSALEADNQYWWGVVPIDFDGRPGQLNLDQVSAFSTAATASGSPLISGIYDELLDTYAECIDSSGNIFYGYNYDVYFDYEDAQGDAGESDGAYIIVNGYDWDWVTFDGDGASGSVTVNYCSSTAGDRLSLTMVDGAGWESDPLIIDLTTP
jgi:hypothetical protein